MVTERKKVQGDKDSGLLSDSRKMLNALSRTLVTSGN